MKPLLTVVIPVYNVEKYLKRCIESILIQEWKNYDILLVMMEVLIILLKFVMTMLKRMTLSQLYIRRMVDYLQLVTLVSLMLRENMSISLIQMIGLNQTPLWR